jgi:hypothetical protein
MTNSTTVDQGHAMPGDNEIARIITGFGASESVIDATLLAFLEVFTSDDFAESHIEYRKAVAFDFRLLIDTLFQIHKVEMRRYDFMVPNQVKS